jgi:PIN like domain
LPAKLLKTRKNPAPQKKQTKVCFFVDRSIGAHLVPKVIRDAGIDVIVHDEYFTDPETEDSIWLTVAGQKRWVVLTHDEKIRYRPQEKQALLSANTLVIVITGGHKRGIDIAERVAKVLPKMLKLAATAKRLALYKLTDDLRISQIAV